MAGVWKGMGPGNAVVAVGMVARAVEWWWSAAAALGVRGVDR